MKMTFTFKHLDHSDALENYAEERIDSIAKFLLKDGHGHCYFSKTRGFFSVEISMNTRLKFYKASSQKPDIYLAFDEVIDKLEKQFLKIRKTHQHHKKAELSKWGKMKKLNSMLEHNMPLKKAA